jgi:hypothetical protein
MLQRNCAQSLSGLRYLIEEDDPPIRSPNPEGAYLTVQPAGHRGRGTHDHLEH